MKVTKEEVSLCEQVAEKYRKKIKVGDWILDSDNQSWIVLGIELWKSSRPGLENTLAYELEPTDRNQAPIVVLEKEEIEKYLALWQISDCLEFLREYTLQFKGLILTKTKVDKKWTYLFVTWHKDNEYNTEGKTPLEACLKSVLAVIEEK